MAKMNQSCNFLLLAALSVSFGACGGDAKKTDAKDGKVAEKAPAGDKKIEEPKPAAMVPMKVPPLPLEMDLPSDAKVMDGSVDAPNATVSTSTGSINVSTVTEAYPKDFAGAKKSIEGDPNKFKAFTKQEEIEGGWHLEFELASMSDQAPLYGVQIRKTIDGKQYNCARNDRDVANRDAIAKACLTLRKAT
ncbi:MAG: hypothetical protein H0T76_11330 [Nannocystis sp.]|nr:hypothetical protein [Nannocystis sp.]MBA3547066.1 hypothetical protein [Nannocystis sp.]